MPASPQSNQHTFFVVFIIGARQALKSRSTGRKQPSA
jgi:hypothetical protein